MRKKEIERVKKKPTINYWTFVSLVLFSLYFFFLFLLNKFGFSNNFIEIEANQFQSHIEIITRNSIDFRINTLNVGQI